MKQILSIVLVLVLCGSLQAQDEFKPLFSGTDLSGWISKKEKKKEKAGRFSVNEEEKAIHTYAGEDADSKQDVDYLYTEKEYSNYVLKLEYKWLDKRFKPRAKHDRDAGLLFHLHGDMEGKWPDCLEMQLGGKEILRQLLHTRRQ